MSLGRILINLTARTDMWISHRPAENFERIGEVSYPLMLSISNLCRKEERYIPSHEPTHLAQLKSSPGLATKFDMNERGSCCISERAKIHTRQNYPNRQNSLMIDYWCTGSVMQAWLLYAGKRKDQKSEHHLCWDPIYIYIRNRVMLNNNDHYY